MEKSNTLIDDIVNSTETFTAELGSILEKDDIRDFMEAMNLSIQISATATIVSAASDSVNLIEIVNLICFYNSWKCLQFLLNYLSIWIYPDTYNRKSKLSNQSLTLLPLCFESMESKRYASCVVFEVDQNAKQFFRIEDTPCDTNFEFFWTKAASQINLYDGFSALFLQDLQARTKKNVNSSIYLSVSNPVSITYSGSNIANADQDDHLAKELKRLFKSLCKTSCSNHPFLSALYNKSSGIIYI
jgi:hypothetical protein